MAFQASKERGRKKEPAVKGKQLIPSASVAEWYGNSMKSLIREMVAEYKEEIGRLMRTEGTRDHFAADAKLPVEQFHGISVPLAADAKLPVERFKGLFSRLMKKWRSKVDRFAEKTAQSFAMKVDKHSFVSVGSSLKAMGIKEARDMPKAEWEKQIAVYVAENIALIKSIPEELHSKVERATWNSLTSPEGQAQGAYGINNAIQEMMGKSFNRAEFIAQDQTAKLNSVLNVARLEQNGLDRFTWAHSSAGKKPRPCHVKWDGRTFLTRGGPTELWEVLKSGKTVRVTPGYDGARESDIGKPGHPPRCRCRAVPVIDPM